uniref:Uncharacterized protein n=1 Tax=Tetranychus urticae TaxID=32264 RepID=T1KJ44_TETUR
MVGSVAVLSDFRNGKKIIKSTVPSSKICSTLTQSTTDTKEQIMVCDSTSFEELDYLASDQSRNLTHDEKGRLVKMISDGLACWYFLVHLFHIIKKAFFVKVHMVKPDKISLNQRRIKNISLKLHETMFKQS